MAFSFVQFATSIAGGQATTGGISTHTLVYPTPPADGNLLFSLLAFDAVTGDGTFATAYGWNLIGTFQDTTNSNSVHAWLWRTASGESGTVNHYGSVPGAVGGENWILCDFNGSPLDPNYVEYPGTVRQFTDGGHGTETTPIASGTDTLFVTFGGRGGSFNLFVDAAFTEEANPVRTSTPTFSNAVAWRHGTGFEARAATWSKSNAFYFNLGIIAFNAAVSGNPRVHDTGIGRGIARGIFNG